MDNLYKILLSTVLRQNANNTTSPTNAFNLNSVAVQAYLTQKLKGILPNASGNITENELMTAWLLANSGGGRGGTVTSVDISSNGTALTISGNPITTAGVIALDFNGANTDYVDGTGAVQPFPTITSGTVTSVDLTMPSAFAVSGNPITTAGTLAVTGAGTTSQYVRGDGTLANFPTSTGGGASISYYLNGSINQGTFSGNTYYEMNRTPVIGTGTNFTIAANGYISQFITDANDPSQLNIPAGNWGFEMYFQASSNGGSPSFYVELYKWDGAAFTLIASSSTNPEGITNGTTVDLYTTALAVPATTLSLTDRLAVRVYVNNSGRTITLHTEDNNLCQVITTFTTGLTALNGLTAQVQTLATGTTGTDFNIVSATATHTFNLPVASATNTGKLSSTDWSTFNAKGNGTVTSVAALTLGTTGTDLSSTVANSTTTPVITLNVPTASALNRGALSAADWTTFNSKGNGTVTSIATAGLISGGTITSSGTITTSVTTNKLVGRATAGTGVMEEITLGTGLSFTGTTLNATGGGLTVGTTAIASGTAGRILFEGAGTVLQENAILNLDTTSGLIIGGATARGTRLTIVNSANTYATKIFVQRNAADSSDYTTLRGDGSIDFANLGSSNTLATILYAAGGTLFSVFGTTGFQNMIVGLGNTISVSGGTVAYTTIMGNANSLVSTTGNNYPNQLQGYQSSLTNSNNCIIIGSYTRMNGATRCNIIGGRGTSLRDVTGTDTTIIGTATEANALAYTGSMVTYFNNAYSSHWLYKNGNIGLFGQKAYQILTDNTGAAANRLSTYMDLTATNTLTIHNGTAPAGNITDAVQIYAADITAGNTATFIRNENGDIVKLYKETTAVAAAALVSNLGTPLTSTDTIGGYTLLQVVKALQLQGLLA